MHVVPIDLDLAQRDSDLGFWEVDFATQAISITDGLYRLIGLPVGSPVPTSEELLGMIHDEDRAAVVAASETAIRQRSGARVEFRLRRGDGDERTLRADVMLHRDAEGSPLRLAGMVRDVTDLRRALAELGRERALSELLYAVATAANEANTVEQATRRVLALVCEGLSFQLGHACFPAQGTDPAAPIDLAPAAIWHDADPARFAAFRAATEAITWGPGVGVLGRVLRDGELFCTADLAAEQGALRAEAAAGAGLRAMLAVPIWIGREVVGVLELLDERAPTMDTRLFQALAAVGVQLGRVVERARAEAALRADRAALEQFLDGVPVGIFVVDARGRPFYVNRYCREHVFERVGQPITEALLTRQPSLANAFIAGTDQAYPLDRLPGVRALAGETSVIEDLEIRAPSRTIPLQVWGTPIFDAHGRVKLSLTAFIDISARRHLEQIKDEFISVVSHELRTPLTAIRGPLGLLLGGALGELGGEAREMLEIAEQNCERLIRLVNELLDMQKIESLAGTMRVEQLALEPLLEQAEEEVRPYAEALGVRLMRVDTAEGAAVMGDADRLLQVIANLVSNAAKFSPPGGVVCVETRRAGERVRVEVQDRGPGVLPSFREHLFRKFSQAETSDGRRRGGTGLGLAICKSIIDKLDGQVGFEPNPGGGSIFYFELPAAP